MPWGELSDYHPALIQRFFVLALFELPRVKLHKVADGATVSHSVSCGHPHYLSHLPSCLIPAASSPHPDPPNTKNGVWMRLLYES